MRHCNLKKGRSDMKTRFHVVSLLCLVFALAVTAGAGQLTLQTDSESNTKYVNMPVTGIDTLVLSEQTSFKVYDDGGKDGDYADNADGYLVLIFPAGKMFDLNGTLASESYCDFLTIYEGDLETGNRLLDNASGSVQFGAVVANKITLNFRSDGSNTDSGIYIAVDYPDLTVQHSVGVADVDGGSIASNKASAVLGDTVTLTATPDSGYVLWSVTASNAYGNSVKIIGGDWISNNTAKLVMPFSNVSVTPEFARVEDVEYMLSVNLPEKGMTIADIPAGVDSIRVYDDGGEYDNYAYNADGSLVLRVPENHALLLSGYTWINSECAGFEIYDGVGMAGNVLFYSRTNSYYNIDGIASSTNAVTVHFYSGECWTNDGLNLKVRKIDLTKEFAVHVADVENGTVSPNKTSAAFSESVTLTATPETGYLLWNMEVTSASEFPVKMDGGKWYSNNSATVSMPYADIEVSPEFVDKKTADDGLFVDMPKTGTVQATIPNAVTSFKVYDDGGEDSDASRNVDGDLVLAAPENHVLLVTGHADFRSECGELVFYDGAGRNGKILESQENGSEISGVASSSNVLTIHFNQGTCSDYTKLDLLVRNVNLALPHTVLAIEVAGGTISTNKATAKPGETITVTVRPESGYILSGLSGHDNYGTKVKFNFDGNIATFAMPLSDVTLEPVFKSDDGLFINMPTQGTKIVAMPENVNTFHVYDDGGNSNNYSNSADGYLTVTVPENHVMRIDGYVYAESANDTLFVYDGSKTGKVLWKNFVEDDSYLSIVVTSGNSVTFYFKSNERKTHYGLDLLVEIVDVSGLREVSVKEENYQGILIADKTEAKYGDSVSLRAVPKKGYFVWTIDADGVEDISIDGKIATIKMPYSYVYAWPTFSKVYSIEDGLYINMPHRGIKTMPIPEGVTSFKVYDNGGMDSEYSSDADGYLSLIAPEGYVLRVKGSMKSECPYDVMTILDGVGKDGEVLLDRTCGNNIDVDPVASSGRSLTLYFHSNHYSTEAGLDLDVELLEAATEHSITVAAVDGGTMSASAKKSVAGKTITLTATPADKYLLDRVGVVDADGDSIWMRGGRWYLGNVATLLMPPKDISVTPIFTDKLTSEGNLHIDMPKKGLVKATIPANVPSFKVYDDGGKDGPYSIDADGILELTAPAGKVFVVRGTVTKAGGSYMSIFNGDTSKVSFMSESDQRNDYVFGPFISSQNVMAIQFSGYNEPMDGFDLEITVTDPPIKHSITVASVEGGYLECYYDEALLGEEISLYPYPQEGYILDSIRVENSRGEIIRVKDGYWHSRYYTAMFKMSDTNVVLTPVFSKKTSAEDGLYINLPLDSVLRAEIPSSVTSFMVYDNGGKNGNYGNRANGSVVLMASGGLFDISGSMNTEKGHDTVGIYYGDYPSSSAQLLVESGKIDDIGKRYGTNRYMTIELRSDTSGNSSGFAFKVNVHDASIMHAVAIANTTGGQVECEVDSALVNEEIILSITPEDGYILDSLNVIDERDSAVKLTEGGYWYSGDTARFMMPYADVTVKPVFKKKHTAEDGLYIDMENGWIEAVIPKCVTSFKVYDNGGKNGNYGDNGESGDCRYYSRNDYLELVPAYGYVMQVTGSMNTDEDYDYLSIYDGNSSDEELRLMRMSGKHSNIGSYSTTNHFMYIEFEYRCSSKSGYDLTVTVEEAKKHSITVVNSTGGTVTSDKAEAIIGDTITLTATPRDGYLLNKISVVDAQGKKLNVTGGSWYTDMEASFVMPAEDVVVTYDYTNKRTAEGGLFIEMPYKDELSFEIPEDVKSFKLYDDGGKDGDYTRNANGSLELTAPAGYVFKFAGEWELEYSASFYIADVDDYGSFLSVYSDDEKKKDTVVSYTNKIRAQFYAGWNEGRGIDFTVSVVPQNVIIAKSYYGSLECDNVSASEGDPVLLTAKPDDSYILHHIGVTDLNDETVEVEGGKWYSDNLATFTMPSQKVKVVQSYTYIYDDDVEYEIEMPKSGTVKATIPEVVKSFKVYDDGGKYGDYSNGANGVLVMTAPEGYVFEVTGSIATEEDSDVFVAYDGDRNGKELFKASGEQSDIGRHISSGEVMTFSFATNAGEIFEGLNLNVAVVKAATITKYAAVTVVRTIDSTVAIIDGEYLENDTIAIPEDIDVDAVVYNRSFSTSGYSTITLPFDIHGDYTSGLSAVLEFGGIGLDEKGRKMVRMKYAWCNASKCDTLDGNLKAYTPYIVRLNGENISFYGPTTLKATREPVVRQGDWEFRGTLSKRQWNVGDPELGYAWGFSAEKTESINIGDFVPAVDGTMVRPLRGYIVDAASMARRYAVDMLPAAPLSVSVLPERMKVVLVEDGDDGVEHTTVIGHINTRTGEFKMERAYDLKGRKLNGTPKARGAYYGKKKLVK